MRKIFCLALILLSTMSCMNKDEKRLLYIMHESPNSSDITPIGILQSYIASPPFNEMVCNANFNTVRIQEEYGYTMQDMYNATETRLLRWIYYPQRDTCIAIYAQFMDLDKVPTPDQKSKYYAGIFAGIFTTKNNDWKEISYIDETKPDGNNGNHFNENFLFYNQVIFMGKDIGIHYNTKEEYNKIRSMNKKKLAIAMLRIESQIILPKGRIEDLIWRKYWFDEVRLF